MSRPRLHDALSALFEQKDSKNLTEIFKHPSFADFTRLQRIPETGDEFIQAFIHKSFSHEFEVAHQEQLEFLGDAVLQLILTEELYKRFPREAEGRLSKLRSSIVNEKSLATLARGLKLNEMILVGKGEFKKNLFEQDTVLADTFEAMLAVIYRKNGLEFTRKILFQWLDQFLPGVFENDLESFDWKSQLQEKTLAKFKTLPKYTSEERGQSFLIELWIEGKKITEGIFPNKKAGEKELAESVIKKGLI
ncbi:MAG: ribonuclease III [Bacteriovoracaceae bacterium]